MECCIQTGKNGEVIQTFQTSHNVLVVEQVMFGQTKMFETIPLRARLCVLPHRTVSTGKYFVNDDVYH